MKRTLTWALAFVALANSSVAAEPATNALPAAGDVIRRFIERAAQTALPATPSAWVYFRTNLTEEFNSRDKLSKREELLLKVTDRAGEKEIELLAFNGREPTAREQEQAHGQKQGALEDPVVIHRSSSVRVNPGDS